MAGAERNREFKFIQTDLFQSLSSKMREKVPTKGGEAADGIELTLGLSLNGRFASDPAAGGGGKSMISRSSSISNFILEKQEMKGLSFETPKEVGLGRTQSLPAETEEGRRARKEQESMRRKEVKRKRMEKNKSVREESGSGEIVVEPNAIIGGGDGGGMAVSWGFSSQSSVGSQRCGDSGSSGVSDYETYFIKGTGKEEKSPASAQSPTQDTVEKAVKTVEAVVENPLRVPVADDRVMDAMNSIMSDMPCVSTRGQHGRRVDGFLYKYRNGKDLKIVCICHGCFLSPAEFVKHAGGGDVENPLKHIIVSSPPLL